MYYKCMFSRPHQCICNVFSVPHTTSGPWGFSLGLCARASCPRKSWIGKNWNAPTYGRKWILVNLEFLVQETVPENSVQAQIRESWAGERLVRFCARSIWPRGLLRLENYFPITFEMSFENRSPSGRVGFLGGPTYQYRFAPPEEQPTHQHRFVRRKELPQNVKHPDHTTKSWWRTITNILTLWTASYWPFPRSFSIFILINVVTKCNLA